MVLVALLAAYVSFVDRDALCFADKPTLPLPIELLYFHSRGRAESIRLLLELTGIPVRAAVNNRVVLNEMFCVFLFFLFFCLFFFVFSTKTRDSHVTSG